MSDCELRKMFEDKGIFVCRLCLSSCYYRIDIFDRKGHNGLLVCAVLKELLQLDVSTEDGLPATICERCLDKLTIFKNFKTMCIKSRIEFLRVMVSTGLVDGAEDACLPLPNPAMDSQPEQPKVLPNIVEIPEDRDPLEFLIDERALLQEKSLSVKPKKSSSFAIDDFGSKDNECMVLQSPEEVEVIEVDDDDDGIAIVNEDAEEEANEDEVGSAGEESEVASVGTVDSQSHTTRYVCHHRECGREFDSLKGLRIHAQHAHEVEKVAEPVVAWRCPFCDHTAGNRKLLAIHMKAQHKSVASDAKSTDVGRVRKKVGHSKEPNSKETSIPDVSGRIPANGKVVECRVNLTSIGGDVNKGVRTSSIQASSPSSQKERVSEKGKKDSVGSCDQMICGVCLRIFENKDLLTTHVENVHGQKCYFCRKCSKSFKSHHQFVRHTKMHQANKELMYWCNRCLETFSSSTAVTRHMRDQHNAAQPVVCDYCLCGHLSRRSLSHHVCRLFGHMFPCPRCGRVFKQKRNCWKHVKICKRLQDQKKK